MNFNRDYRAVLSTGKRTDRLYRACLLREQHTINAPVIGICLVVAVIILLLAMVGCAAAETDQQVIASVIAAEGCSQGEKGMHAIGSTILNRSVSRQISPAQVVKQKNQYFGWTASNRHSLYSQCKTTADNIAGQVINGTLQDITDGAEYFLLPGEPVRRWHGEKTVTILSHTFYKEVGK